MTEKIYLCWVIFGFGVGRGLGITSIKDSFHAEYVIPSPEIPAV